MLRRIIVGAGVLAFALSVLALPGAHADLAPALPTSLQVDELRLSEESTSLLRERWGRQLVSKYGTDTWAPLKMELDDADLALMGLPPKSVLLSQRYPKPTVFGANGQTQTVGPQAVFAGAGFFGIRPGGWLLLLSGDGVGWCSFAHVYGSPGSYSISTAGHCGKVGDIATVIGVEGNRSTPISGVNNPVLMDIGKFSKSTGDGGIGKDWALISVDPAYQHLVTPTMAAWGGPIGMYKKVGDTVALNYKGPWWKPGVPSVTTNTDPFLVQQVLHYGHGTGVGAGGTPRSGTSISWKEDYFTFFGAISPGDSGSGTNTLAGDSVGAHRQAAGINTHIYIDGLQPFKTGTGVMAGTRATLVTATLANGQLLPYPAPMPISLP